MRVRCLLEGLGLFPISVFSVVSHSLDSDRRTMDMILGTAGIYTPSEDTYRATFPRMDVRLRLAMRFCRLFSG